MNLLTALVVVTLGSGLNDRLDTFPLGFWNVESIRRFTEHDVELWAEAGITVTHGPLFSPSPQNITHMKRLLDWAHQRGIKLTLGDARTSIARGKPLPKDYAKRVKQAVSDFGSHPAVLGFRILDEPSKDDLPATMEAMRIVKQAAPHLHPFVNQLPWYHEVGSPKRVGYPSWQAYLKDWCAKTQATFLSYDCYVQMNPGNTDWVRYFRNLNEYRTAAANAGIPYWTIILATAHFKYRAPSEADLRWQVNSAAAYGAKGIFYYNWYTPHHVENWRLGPIDEAGNVTPTYHRIKRINTRFLKRYGRLFLDLTLIKPMQWPKPIAGCEPFKPDDVIKSVGATDDVPLIISRFEDKQGRPFVVVVNNTTDRCTQAHLTFHGGKTRVRQHVWGPSQRSPRRFSVGPGTVAARNWLAPGQMEVYRVEVKR